MRMRAARSYALAGISMVVLVACSNATTPLDPGQLAPANRTRSGMVAQSFLRAPVLAERARPGSPHGTRGRSWMDRDVGAKNLLYVSDYWNNAVYVLAYPGGKLVGTLTGFQGPDGECVDGAGNVWITNTLHAELLEYAHGGTSPIAKLKDPGEYPVGCAIDPTTGNLAVTNIYGAGSPALTAGNLFIYEKAKGKPDGPYYDSLMYYMYFCGYDDQGNLFLDGESYGGQFRLAEVPAKSNTFTDISVDQSLGQPGGVQWDGQHVALGDQQSNTIYQLAIAGSGATVVGSTSLSDAGDVVQFWVDGSTVIGPDAFRHAVGFWNYPAGGVDSKLLRGRGFTEPIGAVISPSE
jgi:DNA-binding beta-propeller fold protein YncE